MRSRAWCADDGVREVRRRIRSAIVRWIQRERKGLQRRSSADSLTHGLMTTHIRDGWWCDCEQSCNVHSGKFEPGVSVYETEERDGGWKPYGHAWEKNKARLKAPDAIWVLVEGAAQGNGADKEPLLKGVEALHLIVWDSTKELFVRCGDPTRQPKNHPGFPGCVCEDSVAYFRGLDAADIDDKDLEEDDEELLPE